MRSQLRKYLRKLKMRCVCLDEFHKTNLVVAYPLVFLCWLAVLPSNFAGATGRHITVADGVTMTRLAWAGRGTLREAATFSPDRSRFFLVTEKGNVQNNTVEYSLLLWRTAEIFGSPNAELLTTFASSSNRPAIQDARWLDDHTISFLAENPGEQHQLYTFDLYTRKLTKLTSHATSLVGYAISSKGGTIVFAADKRPKSLFTEEARRKGIHVDSQLIVDLIMGLEEDQQNWWKELYLKRPKSTETALASAKEIVDIKGLSISPDGKYVIAQSPVTALPDGWLAYDYPFLQASIRSKQFTGQKRVLSAINRYVIIDTATDRTKPLLDGPVGDTSSEVSWAADSHSVVVSDVYLPLDAMDLVERKNREAKPYAVEVQVSTGEMIPISNKDLWLIGWDPKTDILEFAAGRLDFALAKSHGRAFFARNGTVWQELQQHKVPRLPEIIVDENSNLPPRIVAIDPKDGKRALLLDLNPQFGKLAFGRVDQIQWMAKDGDRLKGGLTLPPDYVPGTKYPLIIQPYGFNPDQFWIDGPWPTAFAAQALASRGFIVLQAQLYPDKSGVETPDEGSDALASYEGAIDVLDSRGFIDRTRIGLVGFSHTCFHVKYALTHSKYHFGAAVVADGVDGGYFQYIAYSNLDLFNSFFEGVNGGTPFGKGLSSWLRLSPGFNLDKVTTPLLIQAIGRNLPQEWEWFSGLSRLHQPVDLIYLPFGSHILTKPWEQLTSQQATVDWFAFWLKGEEDPESSKAQQYAIWRELRNRQEENEKGTQKSGSISP